MKLTILPTLPPQKTGRRKDGFRRNGYIPGTFNGFDPAVSKTGITNDGRTFEEKKQ
jgi:hypothetical protein